MWKDKLPKALDVQSISTGPQKCTPYLQVMQNMATLDIVICKVDNFFKVFLEMIEHAFPAYAFRELTHNLSRHLIKARCMKQRGFDSRLHEFDAYLKKFPSDKSGQEIEPLATDKIMYIIYHSVLS